MSNYILHQSEYIETNLQDIFVDLEIANRILKDHFPDQDTTWAYGLYNIFSITSPSTNFYNIYKELSELVRNYLKTDEPLWMQAWLNYHKHDELLKWHTHGYPYHGYICIDPKKTITVFETHTIENKIGQIYFGKGNIYHRVEALEPFDGHRITIGFDVHAIEKHPLVYNYVERPYRNLGIIPLL